MPTAEHALMKMEVAQEFVPMEPLTDAGVHTVFHTSDAPLSRVAGAAPVILPNGLKTGGQLTPGSGNSKVTMAAATVNLNGVADVAVAGADVTMTRPASGKKKISSLVITSGGAVAEAVGADGDDYSETRGAAGGPPLIATTSVEVGQVKLNNNTAVPVVTADLRQVVGAHKEMAAYPLWDVNFLTGEVTFVSALPPIHTGNVAKSVYAQYSTPVRVAVPQVSNFKAPEETHSVTSTQTYDGAIASSSRALGQGSFDAKLQDGVNDLVVVHKNKLLWFEFFPDRALSAKIIGQGTLGISRTFPADGLLTAACTISAETAWTEG